MSILTDPRLLAEVAAHRHPLLFVTVSGAHLYGFPSPDSDYDLRGVHLLPLKEVLGLHVQHETVEKSGIHDGLEIDLVTHDARKFFGLLLKKNGVDPNNVGIIGIGLGATANLELWSDPPRARRDDSGVRSAPPRGGPLPWPTRYEAR